MHEYLFAQMTYHYWR